MTPALYRETEDVLREHKCPKGTACGVCLSLRAVLDDYAPPQGHLTPGDWDSGSAEQPRLIDQTPRKGR